VLQEVEGPRISRQSRLSRPQDHSAAGRIKSMKNPNDLQIIKLLSMHVPPVPFYLNPLSPNIPLSTLFANTPSLCPSVCMRYETSHVHKTAGNIIVRLKLCAVIVTNNRHAQLQRLRLDRRTCKSHYAFI
jgi:hypothetical protein